MHVNAYVNIVEHKIKYVAIIGINNIYQYIRGPIQLIETAYKSLIRSRIFYEIV